VLLKLSQLILKQNMLLSMARDVNNKIIKFRVGNKMGAFFVGNKLETCYRAKCKLIFDVARGPGSHVPQWSRLAPPQGHSLTSAFLHQSHII